MNRYINSSQYETNKISKPTINAETCDNKTAELFCENQMKLSHLQEEAALRKMKCNNVKPLEPVKTVKLHIHYKDKKLNHFFIEIRVQKREDFCIAYHYKCDIGPCMEAKTSYISRTTKTIEERMKHHTGS